MIISVAALHLCHCILKAAVGNSRWMGVAVFQYSFMYKTRQQVRLTWGLLLASPCSKKWSFIDIYPRYYSFPWTREVSVIFSGVVLEEWTYLLWSLWVFKYEMEFIINEYLVSSRCFLQCFVYIISSNTEDCKIIPILEKWSNVKKFGCICLNFKCQFWNLKPLPFPNTCTCLCV